MKLVNTLFLIAILFYSCNNQNKELEKIISNLSKINEVHYENIGIGGMVSEHYLNFEKLKEIASTEIVIELTKSENNVVGCYASWALCDRKYDRIENIFEYFLKNENKINVVGGCIGGESNISDEIYYRIHDALYYFKGIGIDSVFYKKKLIIIDSIIIHSDPVNSELLPRALMNRKPKKEDYSRIRSLALENENESAIAMLARFNVEEDIHALIKLKGKNILAIPEFPHPVFWDYLMSH